MRDTCSKLWMWSTPDASNTRKYWIPRPERFSRSRAVPSYWTVRKRPTGIIESSIGIALVPRTSAINRGSCGGSGSTMVVRCMKAGGRRIHWFTWGWCLGGTWSHKPIRGWRMKVETLGWSLKGLLPSFWISLYLWFSWLSPPQVFGVLNIFRHRGPKLQDIPGFSLAMD